MMWLRRLRMAPSLLPQKKKKQRNYPMGSIFSLYQRSRVPGTQPLCMCCFHPFLPSPPRFRPQGILPQHIHTQDDGPSKIKLPGSPRWPPGRRSPLCVAHEPAALTSREGGRMERQPHLPAPQHVLPLLGV